MKNKHVHIDVVLMLLFSRCVVTFENQSIKNPLVVVNSGEDITEVQSNFSNDGVFLALLRVVSFDNFNHFVTG